MKVKEAELFLLDQVDMPARSKIAGAVSQAYEAADKCVEAEPILQEMSALDNRGRLVAWSVDRSVRKLIDSGRWNVDYSWKDFTRPTGHYLEIRTSYAVLTISQVEDPAVQPRNVLFRENLRLSPQIPLPFAEFSHERLVAGVPHALLLHGHQELQFLHLGIPHPRHADGYIYRTPSFLNLPRLVDVPQTPVEDTDYEAVMTLKEEIDRWRRDNER